MFRIYEILQALAVNDDTKWLDVHVQEQNLEAL